MRFKSWLIAINTGARDNADACATRAALKHLVVRAASCGCPGPLVRAQLTLTNVALVATFADGNARSMPRARNLSVHDCARRRCAAGRS